MDPIRDRVRNKKHFKSFLTIKKQGIKSWIATLYALILCVFLQLR